VLPFQSGDDFLCCKDTFLFLCNATGQSFLIVAKPFEFYLGSYCLCLYVSVHSLCFSAIVSKFQVTYHGLWSTLNFYWNRVKDTHLVSIFCIKISSFPNICWRGYLFSIVCFGHLCQNSGGSSCVDSYLDLLFWSIGFHVCFCASTILFLLLWVCSAVWSCVLCYS
jgi:hypothetical protein